MSLRPRFGDGGLLRRPVGLRGIPKEHDHWTFGDIVGRFSPTRDWDPFERTPAGLLLAEDFARADLVDFDAASEWYINHGVLDLRNVFPGDDWRPYRDPEPPDDTFHDSPDDVREQQAMVDWLLFTLARLSQGAEAWDPRWMEAVVRNGEDSVWLDVSDRLKVTFRPGGHRPATVNPVTLWVPARPWYESWSHLRNGGDWPKSEGLVPVDMSREGHIEFVRRLLEPQIRVAAQFEVEMLWPNAEYPLIVSERRRWRSVLSPIYLQLLEGLRRITDGQRGAGFCRECGQPFLTLDARRSSFCTDKDRFRFSQRERRKRVDRERAALDAIARMQEIPADAEPTADEEPEG